MGDRILEGFYVSRADNTLQLLIFGTHPVKYLHFGKFLFTKNNSKSGMRKQFEVRNANQERDQEPALSRGLQLTRREKQHEPLHGSDEALARQVLLAVLLLP